MSRLQKKINKIFGNVLARVFNSANKPTKNGALLKFDVVTYQKIIERNRLASNAIENWLPDFSKSIFRYGIPDHMDNVINKKINNDLTYTDIMMYLCKQYKVKNYLELGVSVGKNFLPLTINLDQTKLVGFDIEDLSSVLKSKLNFVEQKSKWVGDNKSIRETPSTLDQFALAGNDVYYLAGDVLDERSWFELKKIGLQFDFIFSDALHEPDALLFEYSMIKKYDLMSSNFIIMWDDVHPHMKISVADIANRIRFQRSFKKTYVYFFEINGWMGEHESKHPIGIVSSYKLDIFK